MGSGAAWMRGRWPDWGGSSEASDKEGDGAGVDSGFGRLGRAGVRRAGVHNMEDVTGDTLVCESTTYTITSGSIKIVIHEGAAASGNANFTVTLTPQQVVAEDPEGNVYSLRGAFWFGGAFNAQQGTEVFMDTGKLQVVTRLGSDLVCSCGVVDAVDGVLEVVG